MHRIKRIALLTILGGFSTLIVIDTFASQQEQEVPAERVYKNIKVLTGIPASKLDGAMYYMSAALGVSCDHCHTDVWESDAKPAKEATRKMIVMTRELNKQSFSGYDAVSCYTCHQGKPNTLAVIPLSEIEDWIRLNSAPASNPDAPPGQSGLPTIDRILADYTNAIGGEAAIARITTRVSKGTLAAVAGTTAATPEPLEVYRQAPNKLVIVTGDSVQGFDGQRAWVKGKKSDGVSELAGDELVELKRDAEFYRYLKLKESYSRLGVLGKDQVGGRDAYVVGATGHDQSRERLYFDVKTGLLIRRYYLYRTVLGSVPEVTDFDDYRDAGGVKLPFMVRSTRPPFISTSRFTEIQVNVPIEATRFERPSR
jgi:hypothetical protein